MWSLSCCRLAFVGLRQGSCSLGAPPPVSPLSLAGPRLPVVAFGTEQVLVWRGRSTGCESVSCLAWSALSCPRRRLGRLRRVFPGGCLASQAVEGFRYHTYSLRRSGACALRRGSQCRSTGPPTPSGTAIGPTGMFSFQCGRIYQPFPHHQYTDLAGPGKWIAIG